MAERCLSWIAKGTHRLEKFIKPQEMEAMLGRLSLRPLSKAGLVFNPLKRNFHLSSRNLSTDYVMCFEKPVQ